jgi:hypothetical protein
MKGLGSPLAPTALIENFEVWGASSIDSWSLVGSTGAGTSYGSQTVYVTQGSKGGTVANDYTLSFATAYSTTVSKTFDFTGFNLLIVDVKTGTMQNGGTAFINIGGVTVWSSTASDTTYPNLIFILPSSGLLTVEFGASIPAAASTRLSNIKFDNLRKAYVALL